MITREQLQLILESNRKKRFDRVDFKPVVIDEVGRIQELSPCWLLTSHTMVDGAKPPYPKIMFQGQRYRVHRLVKMLETNEIIPDGMVVSHICETLDDSESYNCVNPEHIVIETQRENLARSPKKKRVWDGVLARRKERREAQKVQKRDDA